MRKPRTTDLTALPFFAVFMFLAGATRGPLAKASGVSHQTITKVRGGGAIKTVLADILMQTLEERVFVSYVAGPRRARGKYRARIGPTSKYNWKSRIVKEGG